MRAVAVTLLVLPLLAACRETAEEGTPDVEPETAHVSDGVQVADLVVDGMNVEPAAVALRAGVPARLVITRTDAATCADSLSAPDLGVPAAALVEGEPLTVEFTPEEAGTFTLACGMDMVSARLVVQGG